MVMRFSPTEALAGGTIRCRLLRSHPLEALELGHRSATHLTMRITLREVTKCSLRAGTTNPAQCCRSVETNLKLRGVGLPLEDWNRSLVTCMSEPLECPASDHQAQTGLSPG